MSDPHPPEAPPPAPHAEQSVRHRVMARLRTYLIAGILVTAPVGLTIYLAWAFIQWIDARVMPLVPMRYHPESYLPFPIPGLGLIIVVGGLILVGALTANLIGRSLVRLYEHVLDRMPIVRGIYGTLKQVFETVFSHKSEAFRKVVLIEYPRRGIWALGFLTGDTVGEVQNVTSEKVLNVFLPTTPNPTSGFLLFVPHEDVVALDMTVEEGIKMVMSGGIVTPPDRRPKAVRDVPLVSAKTYERGDIAREREGRRGAGASAD